MLTLGHDEIKDIFDYDLSEIDDKFLPEVNTV